MSLTEFLYLQKLIETIDSFYSSFFFALNRKEAEEKCKSEIIDIEIENRNDDNGILQALVRRGSRFTGRYQTYLKIKQNREQRKMSKFFKS